MLALLVTLLVFALGNALGSAVLRARGFGLLSFRRSAAPGRWRAPLARAFGPLALYLFTIILLAVEAHLAGVPASRIGVFPGGTAEASGLETGDRVVEMSGAPVATYYDIAERVAAAGPGGSMPVAVLRGDRRVELQVAVDDRGLIGVRATGEVLKFPWGTAFLQALPRPFLSGARLVLVASRTIRASPPPEMMVGPVALHLDDGTRSPLMTALILQAMFSLQSWYPLVLLAVVSQLVAWARGEGRSPRVSGGGGLPG